MLVSLVADVGFGLLNLFACAGGLDADLVGLTWCFDLLFIMLRWFVVSG